MLIRTVFILGTTIGFLAGTDDSDVPRPAPGFSLAALTKPAPENADDLRAIEEQVTSIVQKVLPSTVALRVGPAHASGVIVTPEGYVLTAAHVIERPGRDVTVLLPDGTTAKGKTLGLNPEVDGGLVQITDKGPWPYAPIAAREAAPEPGDWCVAIGHAGGFQAGRAPPVRLGRVIDSEDMVLRTDCTISMGDSGGPLFDMHGRVVGIHSRITDETSMNLHVPVATYLDAWSALAAGEVAAGPRSRFLARLDTNGDGKITRSEIPEGTYRQVFDRMASMLKMDPEKTYSIEDLSKSLGLSAPRGLDPRQLPFPTQFLGPGEWGRRERFAHGRTVRSAFADVVTEARHSTVRVKCDGEDVALGTIVSSDGWIVTKASQLSSTDSIVCVLTDHRELLARLAASDSRHDLALLRVQATELRAVELDGTDLKPGMWLASVGQAAAPQAIGVLSVAARPIPRSPAVLGVVIDDRDVGPTVRQVMPGSGAAAAGIKEGDLITHISAERVRSLTELQAAVRRHRVGDLVQAALRRGDMKLELAVRLGMPEDSFGSSGAGPGDRRGSGDSPARPWLGALSHRRDDYPSAIQHDTVLKPTDCGGPVVDLAGRVAGINIARADRTASYALPSTTVLGVVDKLKSAAK